MKTDLCVEWLDQNTLFSRNRRRISAAGLVLCLLVLLAPQRGWAQVFPPQGDDTTNSMGLFRIVVDPLFRPLLAPTGPPTSFVGYTGFHSSDGRLTSPLLIDNATTIGRSNPHSRFYTFPQPLGLGSWDTITNGYSDYPAIPFLWFAAPAGVDEVLTEIRSFVLTTVGSSTGQICTNPLVPMVPAGYQMVKAGPLAGVTPRSLGIVQENGLGGPPDFPARSFFDIYVEVNLPWLPGTESSVAFPLGGAILTNVQPLIVTNLDLTSFPPQVIYIHGGDTNAVELRFKYSNPPYWAAGDLFGTLCLAGHGVYPYDCSSEDALAAAVLGTTNAPMPEMPTEWLRSNTQFPSAGSSYDSLMTDTNPPVSSDTLMFASPGQGTIYANNFSLSDFPGPITPPSPGSAATYSDPSALLSFELSVDQQTWFSAQASGAWDVTISNSTPAGSSISTFDTEITGLNLTGTSLFGNLMLRESPTKQSLGRHTFRPEPRGYRVSSFFDVFTELSTDGGITWIAADRSIHLSASAPPAAPGSIFITQNAGGGGVTLEWLGPFTLQQSDNVATGYVDVPGSTGGSLMNSWPITFSPTQNQKFVRLRQ
jgi:hypothetical protein